MCLFRCCTLGQGRSEQAAGKTGQLVVGAARQQHGDAMLGVSARAGVYFCLFKVKTNLRDPHPAPVRLLQANCEVLPSEEEHGRVKML